MLFYCIYDVAEGCVKKPLRDKTTVRFDKP